MVTDGSGNVGWADRLAWESVSDRQEYLSGQTYTVNEDRIIELGKNVFVATFLEPDVKCFVNWNGEAFLWQERGYGDFEYVMGNGYLVDPEKYEDTGEPFCMIVGFEGNFNQIYTSDAPNTNVLLSLYSYVVEKVKPIDPNFIPKTIATKNDLPINACFKLISKSDPDTGSNDEYWECNLEFSDVFTGTSKSNFVCHIMQDNSHYIASQVSRTSYNEVTVHYAGGTIQYNRDGIITATGT